MHFKRLQGIQVSFGLLRSSKVTFLCNQQALAFQRGYGVSY